MLKSDFNGYEEFMKKVENAANEQEAMELLSERQQMWLNKLSDAIFPTPDEDMPFIINALEIIAKDMRRDEPETASIVEQLRMVMEFKPHRCDTPGNMTEAAAKAYRDVKKKQHGIM